MESPTVKPKELVQWLQSAYTSKDPIGMFDSLIMDGTMTYDFVAKFVSQVTSPQDADIVAFHRQTKEWSSPEAYKSQFVLFAISMTHVWVRKGRMEGCVTFMAQRPGVAVPYMWFNWGNELELMAHNMPMDPKKPFLKAMIHLHKAPGVPIETSRVAFLSGQNKGVPTGNLGSFLHVVVRQDTRTCSIRNSFQPTSEFIIVLSFERRFCGTHLNTDGQLLQTAIHDVT
jgi:hypothetical protein